MDFIAQLVDSATATAVDLKKFVASCQETFGGISNETVEFPRRLSNELRQSKQVVLADIVELQRLIMGPSDLIQQLACHAQILACLHWLCHFQVLACIPLRESASTRDIADLVGVPEPQLSRIVRMTATYGFLREPEPGKVAHSALSAEFVTNPSLLDAIVFLANTAVPAALHMPASTQRFCDSRFPSETAYNLASNSPVPFSTACEQRPQLRRQWAAFKEHGTTNVDGTLVGLLESLQCADRLLSEASAIVEIGASSMTQAVMIANHFPLLKVFVQVEETNSVLQGRWPKPLGPGSTPEPQQSLMDGRVSLQRRTMGTPQPVRDAIVYVFHLNGFANGGLGATARERIQSELKQLVDMMKMNSSATVVLTSGLIPDLGSIGARAEARARLRDMTLFQLTNQQDNELGEILAMLATLSDITGRLVLVNKNCLPRTGDLALELKYQAFVQG
ncbi:hypothetical protein ACRALDRAFT_2045052 [Sodiomyces alcalophilus JCM 7366]|uniref:uncharacterized protein n=1 Tax=Sodiomyces alcalophilus JCM 7366 TaxID=591952 RepID=UPI0039B61817